MFEEIELTGELLEDHLIDLILKLRAIRDQQVIGLQNINIALSKLEKIAEENNLVILDLQRIGISEARKIHVKTTLACWALLDRICKE